VPLPFDKATDMAEFRTSVEEWLVPRWRPGDVVIWDELRPNREPEVRQALEKAGARGWGRCRRTART
jgi:hypothetical protein